MDPVAEHFERVAPNYAGHFTDRRNGINFCLRKRLELSCELATGSSGKLLDCASGPGEITCALLKTGQFSSATVNDISAAMQARARALIEAEAHGVATEFVQTDILQFDPNGQKYDLIVCLGLIAHVGRLDLLLSRLKSWLAPGGRILLQSTLAEHPNAFAWRMLTSRIYAKRFGYKLSYFSHSDITKACSTVGLEITASRRYQVGIPLLHLLWDWGSFQVESRLQKWASKHGTDVIYRLEAGNDEKR